MNWDNYNPNPEYPELNKCYRCSQVKEIMFPIIKQKVLERTKIGHDLDDYCIGEIDDAHICMDCLFKDAHMYSLIKNDERESRKHNRFYGKEDD